MSQRFSTTALNAQHGHTVIQDLWKWAKPLLIHGYKLNVTVDDVKSREQENLYHSCFTDLSKHCELAGMKRPAEEWKRALLQAYYEATSNDPDFADDWKTRAPKMVPDLYGRGVVFIPIESKGFTRNLASGFITFVHSVGDERGVKWSRTSLGRDVPDEVAA
jgi:hypothetical protein